MELTSELIRLVQKGIYLGRFTSLGKYPALGAPSVKAFAHPRKYVW